MKPPVHTPASEAAEARPWRAGSGTPPPAVHVYPTAARPALWVYAAGEWRLARVIARQTGVGRTLVYQVEIQLPMSDRDDVGTFIRAYGWPQDALVAADPDESGQ